MHRPPIINQATQELEILLVEDDDDTRQNMCDILALDGHRQIRLKGLSPDLLARLPIREAAGRLEVGVVAEIPPHLVGAGLGLTSEGGSIHMQSTDRALVAEHGLDRLRLGDVVALRDTDSRYNHGYLRDACAIGVVCATDGPRAGYGPGIVVVMTAPEGRLSSFTEATANIADLLALEA